MSSTKICLCLASDANAPLSGQRENNTPLFPLRGAQAVLGVNQNLSTITKLML